MITAGGKNLFFGCSRDSILPTGSTGEKNQAGCWMWCTVNRKVMCWRILRVSISLLMPDLQLTTTDNGRNQHWYLDGQAAIDTPKRFTQWMKHVPDDKKLNMLNFPGTHQSIACQIVFGVKNPECQERSPCEQLMDGICYTDLRFAVWTVARDTTPTSTCLFAKHGVAPQGYTWLAFLLSVGVFLRRFPTETIMVAVNLADDVGKANFWTDFSVWWDHNQDLLYTYAQEPLQEGNPRRYAHKSRGDVSLGEVRGKLILLVSTDTIDGIHKGKIYATSQAV